MKRLVPLIALLVAACNDGSAVDTLDVALEPDSITMVAGTTTTVNVNVTRSAGLSGTTVYLTVDGTGDGLTALADSTLATEDTQVVTISTTPSTPRRLFALNITVTGTTLQRGVTLYVDVTAPAPVSVTGQLVDRFLTPMPNTALALWSDEAATPYTLTTDTNGSFTASDVVQPYDVVVTTDAGYTYLFATLDSITPRLSLISTTATVADALNVTGAASGVGDGYRVTAETDTDNCQAQHTGDATYACALAGSAENVITVRALACSTADGSMPTSFEGYDEGPAERIDATSATRDLVFAPLTTHTLHVEASESRGTPTSLHELWVAGRRSYELGVAVQQSILDLAIPDDTRVTLAIAASAAADDGSSSTQTALAGTEAITFALPDPRIMLTPIADSTITASTSFEVSPRTGAVTVFTIDNYIVVADAYTIAVAKLAARGLTLNTLATHTWNASQIFGQGEAADGVSPQRVVDQSIYTRDVVRAFTVN